MKKRLFKPATIVGDILESFRWQDIIEIRQDFGVGLANNLVSQNIAKRYKCLMAKIEQAASEDINVSGDLIDSLPDSICKRKVGPAVRWAMKEFVEWVDKEGMDH